MASLASFRSQILSFLAALFFSVNAVGQSTDKTKEDTVPDFDNPEVQRSIQYMLKRAELTRTLATEHLTYLQNNRASAEVRSIEDASQVMAFNLVCADEKIDQKTLRHIAADISFKIAMMSGNSTISKRLEKITERQTMNDRMELVGDMATTVLLFEVGRRRGLFDALITDFGKKKFCSGMQADMRTRYNSLASGLGNAG